ncbi:Protein N-acetyltransferase, RimJ/RimL family [Terribacillus halophilus]|uniref:Protein N-acetyltransferase, RimJ/RimL family n=1 Tax=Terribacillus halophilus TaxID=361279 RepID=A0A1G6WUP3_9BACI|nr:GNAT family protein [Terribacillus halophilus]SDD68907.1 Protein N-acetyltransferase, RimJ/RimL family [Terribacillus halophilus]
MEDKNERKLLIREAELKDAAALAQLRLKTDGETEYMDREEGEGYLSSKDFEELIETDQKETKNLCLVAYVDEEIVGYCRCEGNKLKRLSHQVTFGIAILKDYWGLGIGRRMLEMVITWSEEKKIHKINLSVLASNKRAITLYQTYGFIIEGCLKDDKRLSDGEFYDTLLMARLSNK